MTGRHPRQQQPPQQVQIPVFAELVVHFKPGTRGSFSRRRVQAFRQVGYQIQQVGPAAILLVIETTGDRAHHTFRWEDVDHLEAMPAQMVAPGPSGPKIVS